eukprot:sb/3473270/
MFRNLIFALAVVYTVYGDDAPVPSYSTDCIMLNGTISLSVNYTGTDDKSRTDTRKISDNAKVSGTCGDKLSTLVLADDDNDQVLTFTFSANKDKSNKLNNIDPVHWGVTSIKFQYDINEASAKHRKRISQCIYIIYISRPKRGVFTSADPKPD